MGKRFALRLGQKPEEGAITVEVAGPALEVTMKQLVADSASRVLVAQIQRSRAEPLDAYGRDDALRRHAAEATVRLDIFEGRQPSDSRCLRTELRRGEMMDLEGCSHDDRELEDRHR